MAWSRDLLGAPELKKPEMNKSRRVQSLEPGPVGERWETEATSHE